MERERNIYTIPNLLTLFRLCLIPVLVWLYCFVLFSISLLC